MSDVRPWVARLGAYLRIFGPPEPGTFGYLTSDETTPPGSRASYLDHLIAKAQSRSEGSRPKT